MKRDLRTVTEIAGASGFLELTIEKVLRLAEILTELRSHPFLKDKLVLKGGTAIQLFYLDARRLSVDIDLNYIGAIERDQMLEDRPRVDEALQRLCAALGYAFQRTPTNEHAGGKWRLGYQGVTDQPQVLELDVNYLYRVPIWGTENKDMTLPHIEIECNFPVVDARELWAGKIAATLTRSEPRDLYDLACMSDDLKLSDDLRRTAILLASGARNDLRQIKFDAIDRLTLKTMEERLYPVIRKGESLDAEQLKDNARKLLVPLLQFKNEERNYLDLLLDQGDYQPEHLFPEEHLLERAQKHPVLLWKAHNVKEHKTRMTQK